MGSVPLETWLHILFLASARAGKQTKTAPGSDAAVWVGRSQ